MMIWCIFDPRLAYWNNLKIRCFSKFRTSVDRYAGVLEKMWHKGNNHPTWLGNYQERFFFFLSFVIKKFDFLIFFFCFFRVNPWSLRWICRGKIINLNHFSTFFRIFFRLSKKNSWKIRKKKISFKNVSKLF